MYYLLKHLNLEQTLLQRIIPKYGYLLQWSLGKFISKYFHWNYSALSLGRDAKHWAETYCS